MEVPVYLFLFGTVCLLATSINSYPTDKGGEIVFNIKRRSANQELGKLDLNEEFNNSPAAHDGETKSIAKRSNGIDQSLYGYCCGKVCECIKGIQCPFQEQVYYSED